MRKASCMCGAVRIEVAGDIKPPDACHCTQCRKSSGHYYVGADIKRANCTIHGEEYITWYHSSAKVRRGFCRTCGANLLFDPIDKVKHDWIGVAMGAFDDPTNTHIEIHIFVAEKGDYYEITDGLPQAATIPAHATPPQPA
ncbi:MAG: GFA family protein [Kofleriaceae bacterium]